MRAGLTAVREPACGPVWRPVTAFAPRPCPPRGWGFPEEGDEEWLDLRPGRVESLAGDFFSGDFDPFEKGLVEESSFGRFCLEVGVLGRSVSWSARSSVWVMTSCLIS